MGRKPTKRANAKHLCAHLDLIERHKNGTLDAEDYYSESMAEASEAGTSLHSEENVSKKPLLPNEKSRQAKSEPASFELWNMHDKFNAWIGRVGFLQSYQSKNAFKFW